MSYKIAQEMYAGLGVDTEKALEQLAQINLSIHCWQGDDVGGFEKKEQGLFGGGILSTGDYPGKAQNAQQLRQDLDFALGIIPCKHNVNLHAIYAETEKPVERDNLMPQHFAAWVDWAKGKGIGLDINPTFFAHKHAESGFTLSHDDEAIRDFWIDHAIACRKIGDYFAKSLGKPCVDNIWIPDGFKDNPIDRYSKRNLLEDSLDKILADKSLECLDSVESKLFGIGSEACVIGSHEFYMGYAVKNACMLTLDSGHFHPTESIADKLSAIVNYLPGVLLHVSRPIRWDSDHSVILDDELQKLFAELIRNNLMEKVYLGLDFFDGTINRIASWVVGATSTLKAALIAMLEPTQMLRKAEQDGDFTTRIATLETLKHMPWGLVWQEHCRRAGVQADWLAGVKEYEKRVLGVRG